MKVQYFTYVPFFFKVEYITLNEHIKRGFGDLQFEINLLILNGTPEKDGRHLGMIKAEDCDNSTAQQKIDVVLNTFPHTLETPEQSKVLADRWTGRDDITIEDGILIIPDILGEDGAPENGES